MVHEMQDFPDVGAAPLKIHMPSFRRKPESRKINGLDIGLRRCDGFLEAPFGRYGMR